jgi:hypothetical protein
VFSILRPPYCDAKLTSRPLPPPPPPPPFPQPIGKASKTHPEETGRSGALKAAERSMGGLGAALAPVLTERARLDGVRVKLCVLRRVRGPALTTAPPCSLQPPRPRPPLSPFPHYLFP